MTDTTAMDEKWETCQRFTSLMLSRRDYQFSHEDSEDHHIYMNHKNHFIMVWYFKYDKMNIDSIKAFVQKLESSSSIYHGMIIYQNTVTSSTKKVIENLFQFKIELFDLKEFQYDITKFKYYCHHEKVPSLQQMELKKKFGTSLPVLVKNDPIARYFYFQRGDIIRILRKNGTIAYRIVK